MKVPFDSPLTKDDDRLFRFDIWRLESVGAELWVLGSQTCSNQLSQGGELVPTEQLGNLEPSAYKANLLVFVISFS